MSLNGSLFYLGIVLGRNEYPVLYARVLLVCMCHLKIDIASGKILEGASCRG